MSGRIYSVVFGAVAVAAAQDLFELSAAANKPIELVGIIIAQAGAADVGDAQEEVLRIQVVRGNTTSGSGGSAVTPRPVKRTDPAAGFAAEANNTTVASAGTAVTLYEDGFNVRAGHLFMFPEGCEPDAINGELLCLRLPTAPADSITLSGTLLVRELG